jgi:hypothetical protein
MRAFSTSLFFSICAVLAVQAAPAQESGDLKAGAAVESGDLVGVLEAPGVGIEPVLKPRATPIGTASISVSVDPDNLLGSLGARTPGSKSGLGSGTSDSVAGINVSAVTGGVLGTPSIGIGAREAEKYAKSSEILTLP